jgi:hypothetical protein
VLKLPADSTRQPCVSSDGYNQAEGSQDGRLRRSILDLIDSLLFDAVGNLYGEAPSGGASSACGPYGDCGAIFELKPPSTSGGAWSEVTLHSFTSGPGWSAARRWLNLWPVPSALWCNAGEWQHSAARQGHSLQADPVALERRSPALSLHTLQTLRDSRSSSLLLYPPFVLSPCPSKLVVGVKS